MNLQINLFSKTTKVVYFILGNLFFIGEREVKKPKEVSPEQLQSCAKVAVGDKIQEVFDNGEVARQSVVFQGAEHESFRYQTGFCKNKNNLILDQNSGAFRDAEAEEDGNWANSVSACEAIYSLTKLAPCVQQNL